jgi:UDPglucose 6-dehydrogenase
MVELAPHPEVVNHHPRTLIVGWGHVGRQVGRWFAQADYVDVDGVVQWRDAVIPPNPKVFAVAKTLPCTGGLRGGTGGAGYELGFVCVPTPQGEGGSCDTSLVREAFARWGGAARYWCVKSTVSMGTTESLGPNVCFGPEFYGETVGHPLREVLPFVILGGPSEVTRVFATAWTLVTNSELRIYQTDSRTAELCKLMENAWIATKVSFCNQFYELAALAGVDWHELRELWLADPRVSRSHTYVYPDNRGFGGKCIPKDTANLCAWARQAGGAAELIEAVRAYNARLRDSRSMDPVDTVGASEGA